MAKAKRAALYVRVSTDSQTVENQIRELRQVAERRGWEVIGVYNDAGISRQGAQRAAWPRFHAEGRQSAAVRCGDGVGDRPPRALAH